MNKSEYKAEQELRYRASAAHTIRRRHIGTLKSTLRVTQRNHWTDHTVHDLLLDELLDVEYYRNLEMWFRGHSRSLKLVPLESMGAVSYSLSIVTMIVSVAVCELFRVKEWCDLENRVTVRSRSLEMAPFDRSHTNY